MQSVKHILAFTAALVAIVPAHAALAAPTASVSAAAPAAAASQAAVTVASNQPADVGESDGARLAQLQKRIAILQAQKQAAELEKAIREANGAGGTAVLPLGTPPAFGAAQHGDRQLPVARAESVGAPEVRGIDAYNGKFSATLAAAGRTEDVRVGDFFAGWRVTRITAADVTLSRAHGGRTETRVLRY
ncbi:type IV pilus biogenesis protein PilP [Burkholderia multivorans]|uniref:type IV pilus biogenesis protein PilP n=1 Tax=Burkholderia multivorans TaxID=87883 RepID=UPI0019069F68|nr:type IV pilus biogenesis protein PilP [Burkholderia multivorans]MBJ9625028.1 type IV pilus biogenesis protein PilP [Burkholderia multivorans]